MSPKLSVTMKVLPCFSARRGREAGAVARTENSASAGTSGSRSLICSAGWASIGKPWSFGIAGRDSPLRESKNARTANPGNAQHCVTVRARTSAQFGYYASRRNGYWQKSAKLTASCARVPSACRTKARRDRSRRAGARRPSLVVVEWKGRRHGAFRGRDPHGRHHAPVLVRQDMAVDHVGARVVDEAAAHLEVARNERTVVRRLDARGNREDVPPYPWHRRRRRRAWPPRRLVIRVQITLTGRQALVGKDVLGKSRRLARRCIGIGGHVVVGIEYLDQLEWIDVDVEWMRDARRRIGDRPFLDSIEEYLLRILVVVEFLAVDRVRRRKKRRVRGALDRGDAAHLWR